MLHMVLAVLTKCTGIPVKIKEVRDQVKITLPDLLPTWVDALERCQGKSEVAFNTDRFIGQIEMEQLVPSITAVYETLPIAGPPPPGAMPPPPPDWATPSTLEKGVPKVKDMKPKAAAGPTTKALNKADLAHLEWMSKLDEEQEEGEEGKENFRVNSQRPVATGDFEQEDDDAPAKSWMVIYGTDFSAVAKDLHKFRNLFMRSVASALGIPMGCIEIINITRGSIVIEFNILPSRRGGDTRNAETLKQALAQQLSLPHSALRKGPFKDYVQSAELVERPKANRGGAKPDPAQPAAHGRHRDQETQTDGEHQDDGPMQEVLRDLEDTEAEARRWQKLAEDALGALPEGSQRDALQKELEAIKGK